MTNAELWLILVGALGAAATVGIVLLSNRDTKRSMAVSWGEVKEKVSSHGERLDRAEETLKEHGNDIGFLKGRTAAGAGR